MLFVGAAEPFRVPPQPGPTHVGAEGVLPAAGGATAGVQGGGSGVQKVLMQGERVVLPALAATLAAHIDGSFGGGHEKAVMWNEFDGIKKLTDGKYHFVRQSRVGAEGEQAARGGAGLWDFAMQVFFVFEACVAFVFASHVCNFLSWAMHKAWQRESRRVVRSLFEGVCVTLMLQSGIYWALGTTGVWYSCGR